MRGLLLALCLISTVLCPLPSSGQERRGGEVAAALQTPRPTPLAEGMRLIRTLADTHPVPADHDERRAIQSALSDVLIRLDEPEAAWRLTQRFAWSPGALDARVLRELANGGFVSEFRRYIWASALPVEARCDILKAAALASEPAQAQTLIRGLDLSFRCEVTYPRPATREPRATAPRPLPFAEQLRDHIEREQLTCDLSPPLSCVIFPRRHLDLARLADLEGAPEAVLNVLAEIRDRHWRIEVLGFLVHVAAKRADARAAALYAVALVANLEVAPALPQDQGATIVATVCIWERTWREPPWGPSDRMAGCLSGPVAATLHLLKLGDVTLARRLTDALQSYHKFYGHHGNDAPLETDSTRWAWIAVLHLASGAAAEAHAAFERSIAVVRRARDYPPQTLMWFSRYGRLEWAERAAAHLGTLGFDPDDGRRLDAARAWATGAIVAGRADHLRRAMAYVEEWPIRIGVLAHAFDDAATMNASYSGEIARVAVETFEAAGGTGSEMVVNIASAVGAYGAPNEALSMVRSSLERIFASVDEWPGRYQIRWSLEILSDAEKDFQPLELLTLARTRDRYTAAVVAITTNFAERRDFVAIATVAPLLDDIRSTIDHDSLESGHLWGEIALAYASAGDLATALAVIKIGGIGNSPLDDVVEAWRKAIGAPLP